ncbi:MAG TPA: GNAT family N-acetyltransferase [Opitutaceae bacterium]|nr:GNAT family N-acetyltransferase [Opitutaceae bacterium]
MSAVIHAMTPAHIDAARVLWAETEGVEIAEGDRPADLARYLARNPGLSSVALDDAGERVVGAVLCGHDGRRGFVYHLAVATDRRGRGLGRALMRRSLAELRKQGLSRVLLLVAADNDGGHAFWQREGWEDMPFARPMGFDL